MSKKKYIIGIDFGTAYTYIVYFEETEDGGTVTRSPIRLLSDVCNASEAGIRSYAYEANDGTFYVGQEAEDQAKRYKDDASDVKIVLEVYAKAHSSADDNEGGHYTEYVDLPELDSTRESEWCTTKYFETIFIEALKAHQELAARDATEIEFIIGTPPGCGKTYASELKQCVKNGYRDAIIKYLESALSEEEKRSGKKITAEEIGLTVKSSCYPEPLLAGYAWLNKNNNAQGLRDNESCFVVDIGAGTADFAFLERMDGKIRARKNAIDKNGLETLITCGGTELGKHAGDVIDERFSTDLTEYIKKHGVSGGEVRRFSARAVKERLHKKGSKGSTLAEIHGENVTVNGAALDEKNFCVYASTPNAGDENPKIPSVKFADILKDFTALREEFNITAAQILKYFECYNVSNCNKILFVGGSSHLTALKETVTRTIRRETGRDLTRLNLDKLAESREEDLSGELKLNHSSAVAIGACLVYGRPSLVNAAPLRIYIENSMDDKGERTEVHSLIDRLGYCTGPVVMTKNEIKQDIGNSLRAYFRETGDLVDESGNSVFDDRTVSLLNLREPNPEQVSRGFDFVDEDGRLLRDTGKRWPERGTINISLRTGSDADLIILASKHGEDFNGSFVYYLQKIEKLTPSDGKEMELNVIDNLTKKTFDFKIRAQAGDTLNSDEVDFNEKAKFHVRKDTRSYYYYIVTRVGDKTKIALDEALANPSLVTDPDMQQYIKIFNGNWNDEN